MRVHRLRPSTARTTVLILGSLVLTSGCSEEKPPEREPPLVVVETPAQATVTEYLEYTGTLESVEVADVRARVRGFLESIEFEPSTNVEKGQVLFRIEDDAYQAAVHEAEGAVKKASGQFELASATLTRTRRAVEQGAGNDLELLEAEATVQQREGELEIAAAELRDAQLDLGYTEVVAPISGRIDEPHVDVGNLVGAGENTLLATIVRMDRLYAYFDVSESIALRYIARGDRGTIRDDPYKAYVRLQNEDGWPHEGSIDFVDNTFDPGTGTVTVRAVFENDGLLYPGLFARIRVPFEEIEGAMLIDENAISQGLEGEYVLVVGEGDIVERRAIETGGRFDNRVRVIAGLALGERYVVEGVQKARPGMSVRVERRGEGAGDAGDEAGGTGG